MNAMSKKYQRLKRQISNDNGITWIDMDGVYKVGNEMSGAGCTPRIYRTVQADPSIFECDGGNKYYVNEVQYSDNNGLTWITEYQTRGEIMEELSEDCGVAYRWVDVDGEWICEEMLNGELVFEYSMENSATCDFKLNGTNFTATDTPYSTNLATLGIAKLTNCNSAFEDSPITNLISFPDTTYVDDMRFMFQGCSGLTSVNLSNFNTKKVTHFTNMFAHCSGLTSLDVSNFNTINAIQMNYMFWGCGKLTSLDVSNFNTSKVTDMLGMFYGCSGLISLDLSNFDTSNVINLRSFLKDCTTLEELDLSGWDLTHFQIDPDNKTNKASMFSGCNNLKTIYARGCNNSTIVQINDALSGAYIKDNVTIITE